MRKLLLFLLLPLGIMIGMQWADVKRYLTIKSISRGHPEKVPAEGAISYPQDPRKSQAEGTGEFDSASRGGPKNPPPKPPKHLERMAG